MDIPQDHVPKGILLRTSCLHVPFASAEVGMPLKTSNERTPALSQCVSGSDLRAGGRRLRNKPKCPPVELEWEHQPPRFAGCSLSRVGDVTYGWDHLDCSLMEVLWLGRHSRTWRPSPWAFSLLWSSPRVPHSSHPGAKAARVCGLFWWMKSYEGP